MEISIFGDSKIDNDKGYWDNYVGGTTQKINPIWKKEICAFFMEDKLKNAVVLDLGCGFGRMNLFFEIEEYHGLDISERMLEEAKKLNKDKKNATFHLGDGKTLIDLNDNYFDYVICSTVMLHLTKSTLESYAKEILRILKPGGEFIVNFPKHININLHEIMKDFEIKKINVEWKNDNIWSFKK